MSIDRVLFYPGGLIEPINENFKATCFIMPLGTVMYHIRTKEFCVVLVRDNRDTRIALRQRYSSDKQDKHFTEFNYYWDHHVKFDTSIYKIQLLLLGIS